MPLGRLDAPMHIVAAQAVAAPVPEVEYQNVVSRSPRKRAAPFKPDYHLHLIKPPPRRRAVPTFSRASGVVRPPCRLGARNQYSNPQSGYPQEDS